MTDREIIEALTKTIKNLLESTGPLIALGTTPEATRKYSDARMDARDVLRKCQL